MPVVGTRGPTPCPPSVRTTTFVRTSPQEPIVATKIRRITSHPSRKGKVRKEFWLDPSLLREAKAVLGAATEREAVEMALDLVAFRDELVRGARALRSLKLAAPD